MIISFDPAKRLRTLRERGLDFADAAEIFDGRTLQLEDRRRDYGEPRCVSVGRLRGRLVVVIWTPRGRARHVISMRKANAREEARYAWRLEEDQAADTPQPG